MLILDSLVDEELAGERGDAGNRLIDDASPE